MPRKSFTSDDAVLPMNWPGFVFRQLRNNGYSVEALLAETGLKEGHVTDPYFRCGFQPLRRLILNAIEVTGNRHLGVDLALQFQPSYIGLPSYTAMNAAYFREGLEVLERFLFLNFPAIELSLIEENTSLRSDEAAIRVRSKFPFSGIEYFAFSSALIAIHGLLKAMLGTNTIATRVEMAVSRPEDWPIVQTKLGLPVHFESAENQIIFPEALLREPLPGSDPFNHVRLVALCEQFAEKLSCETTAVTQVMAMLERAETLTIPISDIAIELGYSERGLRRQLDRSGTSYRKLVDQVREQRARDLLAGSTQPIKTIAGSLGFEAPSNFARSFKRWTGHTPKAFRDRTLSQNGLGRR